MSRQSKLRNKRTARLHAIFDYTQDGKRVGKRHKGPARTTPKHGKEHRNVNS